MNRNQMVPPSSSRDSRSSTSEDREMHWHCRNLLEGDLQNRVWGTVTKKLGPKWIEIPNLIQPDVTLNIFSKLNGIAYILISLFKQKPGMVKLAMRR